jgi:hypothetical protein
MNTNLVNLIPQFFDSSGNPLSGGTLNTFVAGTSTALATYPTNADAIAGTNANSTAISINASGYPSSSNTIIGVFLKPGKQYKFVLKDSAGSTIYTLDNISNLTDSIFDANGNEVIKFSAVSDAVNEITVTNAATGNSPQIAATGDDTNIGLKIKTKGTGSLELLDGSSNELIKLTTVANAVNELSTTNAVTGENPTLSATGNDTNIGLNIKPKGTGAIQLLDGNGNELLKTVTTAGAVNEVTVTNNSTGNAPIVSATGGDTNIDLALRPKGSGVVKIQDSSGNQLNKAPTIQTFTSTGAFTYTAPTGVQAVIFELQAAGGGSGGAGGAASQGAVGAGGGGGGYLQILVTGSSNLAAITGSVGVGGTAGDSGITTDGGSGGNTTLTINSGSQWVAGGGTGGGRQAATGSATKNGGTAGGTNTLGTNATTIKNIKGGDAGIGIIQAAAAVTNGFGSTGGASVLSNSVGCTAANGVAANAGNLYGGGASGACNGTGASVAGAAGAAGIVVAYEYYL